MHDFFMDDTTLNPQHTTLTEQFNADGTSDLVDSGVSVNHMQHTMVDFHEGHEVIRQSGPQPYEQQTMVDGHVVAHSTPNEMGGVNVYHDGQLAYQTMPNTDGGELIMDANMNQVGFSVNNGMGGLDYVTIGGNAGDIMNYVDPLAHVHEYEMDKIYFK